MNTHPEYKKLREEFFHNKFIFNYLEFRGVDRNSVKYRETFEETYGKLLHRSPLSVSERFYLLVKYVLTSEEWKMSNESNELQSFYNSLKNHSVFELIPSNYERIATSFASCWHWLWRFESYTDKAPVALPGSDFQETQFFIEVFADFAENPTASSYCAKVILEMTRENPSLLTAAIPADSYNKRMVVQRPTINVEAPPKNCPYVDLIFVYHYCLLYYPFMLAVYYSSNDDQTKFFL